MPMKNTSPKYTKKKELKELKPPVKIHPGIQIIMRRISHFKILK